MRRAWVHRGFSDGLERGNGVEHHRLKYVETGVEGVVLGFDLRREESVERAHLVDMFGQRTFLEPCFHHCSAENRETSDTNVTVRLEPSDQIPI